MIMDMLMVFIVNMRMGMQHRFVNMLMCVSFAEMQPNAGCHEKSRHRELHGERFVQEQSGGDGAQEWRGREVSARPRGTKMAKRQDKQSQADAIAEKTHQRGQRRRSE